MKTVKSYSMVVLGSFFVAIAYGFISIPQGFLCGGITGLSKFTGQFIPLEIPQLVLIINLIILSIGTLNFGWDFARKTAFASVCYPACMMVAVTLAKYVQIPHLPMLGAITGGMLIGIGNVIVIDTGGSQCGFDVIGLICNKKFGLSTENVMIGCDAVALLSQAVSAPFISLIYGLLVMLVTLITMKIIYALRSHQHTPVPTLQPKHSNV